MLDQLDLSQRLELRDAAGRTVGVVLASQAIEGLTAEREQLRAETVRLRAEVGELKRALACAEQEAKDYLKSLYALLKKEDVRFEPEELAELDRNGVPLNQFIAELEAADCTIVYVKSSSPLPGHGSSSDE
jgi:hypothetical protein